MLAVKKYHYNFRWDSLIFGVQKIWNLSFLLATTLIFIRTMCFHLDDFPILWPKPSKFCVHLALHATVNSCSPKWRVGRVHCIHNCQIMTFLKCSFCLPLHLNLLLHLFVIANNIRCFINKLWLLPCEFSSVFLS